MIETGILAVASFWMLLMALRVHAHKTLNVMVFKAVPAILFVALAVLALANSGVVILNI